MSSAYGSTSRISVNKTTTTVTITIIIYIVVGLLQLGHTEMLVHSQCDGEDNFKGKSKETRGLR